MIPDRAYDELARILEDEARKLATNEPVATANKGRAK